ncbi:MAG: putative metal-dependent hydrolase [Allomuricauda sp.]|nr:MAG: putative metal-dependent hydrolase [Allomuricauda sp.]
MEKETLEKLRYPIGKYEIPDPITDKHLEEWISILENLPQRLSTLVEPLSEAQLETPYRPGGWTVRQVIHHVSDSHHHSYIRFKWALTEDNPTIKPYLQSGWAELFDSRIAPIQMSLDHLKVVHHKLVYLLRGLSREQLQRKFTHPEDNSETSLLENIGRYVWHGNHHFAHINNLIHREGW